MGKKQHQKDKMYITSNEWTTFYGGKRKENAEFRRLPFDCCSLSLQPFEYPVCTSEGIIFDLLNIVPYLKKYGHNPITGQVLDPKSLTKLVFHKNSEGSYHCPVTFKVFTKNSHIIAIKTSGNVFSYEAVERLNFKPKHFRDLINDEPFKRGDVITIQDPTKLDKFNISDFHYIKNNLKLVDEERIKAKEDPKYYLNYCNPETEDILSQLTKDKEEDLSTKQTVYRLVSISYYGLSTAHYSTNAMAASFTSTAVVPETKQKAAIISDEIVRYQKVKSKGYVRLQTNFGNLNLELHCDLVPRACENFIKLCKSRYYNDTIFHRLIRNFMFQGGDPTGTGKGGESAFGRPFKDEFKSNLVHQGCRGVLSMANSGTNTNKSQFFITFRSCRHLDNKHTVFGKLVGGMDVLNVVERIETDKNDRPKDEIKLIQATVFVDPFEEVDAAVSCTVFMYY
ncbi:uncharacterized protein TRIADDRAFT_29227 [Trichoplax adhaerens]|uniref:RING-type E3 ubiquitin-protein ligase PPIL2 n=1 Tax=Trichoplax adhaerens TaxID=10228 RepID=B3S525_TRIAD|nr:hypothetical protein TRIADDRAFT_29227 [Trichoplax adhaerens]EDV22192.1 hypothetical protein TRIADDRAFT_29227 [Trichoplax adhaerens]|eukprot:XP_002115347.1 hypothetical protein TRIADDRAFT_29227 [Trichoplax adhaerens]